MKKIFRMLVELLLIVLLALLTLPTDLMALQKPKQKVYKIGLCLDDFKVDQ